MKKNLKKILILLILFVLAAAGYFAWSWMQLREDGAVYTSIEDANLPVAYVNILGRQMNELDGFVEDSQKAAGRGDLTLLPADRKLSVTIDKLDSQITGMQYEIRSLDGERLVERTTLDHWEQSGESVAAELPIQNLLTEGSEYRLTIAIATEKHPAVYFYTRVMWQQESRVQEMVDLAVSFSEKTFDYDSARDLTTYLETDPNADNSSLGHVTLKSDFSQLTWKGLSMERVSEPEIHLRELQGIIGTIDLKYVVSEMKDGKAAAYYDVIESFTMKLGAQRIYMMNYDRRADQIFTGESSAYSGDRIQLGVSDAEDLQSVQDEAGKYRAFVANRALWIYDTGKKESTKVFAFRKSENDTRVNYDTYGIKILDVSEAGEIDFAVYGYMSRGNHEGMTGIALYRYESAGNALTERLYLPASTDYGNLRQDINQLCYLSGGQTLYVLMNHAVYSIDLTGKEYMVVADGLTEENFAVSTDASRIAWQDGADIYRSTKLHVMNLETGKKDEISFPDQTVIRLIGFVGTDLVYGLAHPNEQLTMDGRVTGLPLYAVEIVGSNMEMETRYEKPGVSLVDVRIQDSRVHLSRMRQIGSGYQPMDEDTLVCNEEVSKDPLDGIATLNDSAKGRLYCVKLDAGKTARNTKVHVPKQVAAEENDVIVLQNNGAAAQRIYSAYSEGRLKGSYAEFSSAVQAAYDGMGLVTDENDRVVWVRANRSDAKMIRDVQNMAGTVSRYLSDMADGKTTSSDGTELIDARGLTLNQILYFVYAGMPVVAYLGDGSYGLICGYDAYNISCLWYPGTEFAYTDKMGLNDAAAFFEGNGGNDFICFLAN